MLRFFEKFVQLIAMAQVAFSPIAVFVVLAAVAYFGLEEPWNLFLAGTSVIIGVVAGVWFAIYIQRKKGAVEFISRIDASPELDQKEEEKK